MISIAISQPHSIGVEVERGNALPTAAFDVTPGRQEQRIAPPAGHVFSGGVVRAIPDFYGQVTYTQDKTIIVS